MKKYPEFSGIAKVDEFFKFCASLTSSDANNWDVNDLSIRVNKAHPCESQDSPI